VLNHHESTANRILANVFCDGPAVLRDKLI
jgi:hypothetical protein